MSAAWLKPIVRPMAGLTPLLRRFSLLRTFEVVFPAVPQPRLRSNVGRHKSDVRQSDLLRQQISQVPPDLRSREGTHTVR
jgi:hypothetical protein